MAAAPSSDQARAQQQSAVLAEALRPRQLSEREEDEMTYEEADRQLRKTANVLNFILGNSFE